MSETTERRRSQRRRTLLKASLRFINGRSTADCVVRNLSGSGARLELSDTSWLPARFDLEIPHHDIRVPARLAWRSPTAIGVAFGREADEFLHSVRDEARIVSLEAERERLRSRVLHLTSGY